MRTFTLVAALLAATFVQAAPQCEDEICGSSFKSLDQRSDHSQYISRRLTNAKRLSLGLGPAAPTRRDTAKRATASQRKRDTPSQSPTTTIRGVIEVLNTDNANAVLGYISKNSLNQAQYRYEASESDALIVDVTVPVGATSATEVDFKVENSDIPNFLYAGLVQGRDSTSSDISSGSFNYGYFASTNETPAGSTPQSVGNSYTTATGLQRTSESAVWTVNFNTGVLSVQWINTDSSLPTMHLFAQSTALYFGGDPGQFNARYPAPITNIVLRFVTL